MAYILCVSSYSVKKIWARLEIVGNPNRDSELLARKLRNNCKRIVVCGVGTRQIHWTVDCVPASSHAVRTPAHALTAAADVTACPFATAEIDQSSEPQIGSSAQRSLPPHH